MGGSIKKSMKRVSLKSHLVKNKGARGEGKKASLATMEEGKTTVY